MKDLIWISRLGVRVIKKIGLDTKFQYLQKLCVDYITIFTILHCKISVIWLMNLDCLIIPLYITWGCQGVGWHRAHPDTPRSADGNGRQSRAGARTLCARRVCCICAQRARPRSRRATRRARRGPRASRAERGRERGPRAADYARASAHHAARRTPAHAHRQLIPRPPSSAPVATVIHIFM